MSAVTLASVAAPASAGDAPSVAPSSTGSAFGDVLGHAERSLDLGRGEPGPTQAASHPKAPAQIDESESPAGGAGDLASSVAGALLFGGHLLSQVATDGRVPSSPPPAEAAVTAEASSAGEPGAPIAAGTDGIPVLAAVLAAPVGAAQTPAPQHATVALPTLAGTASSSGPDSLTASPTADAAQPPVSAATTASPSPTAVSAPTAALPAPPAAAGSLLTVADQQPSVRIVTTGGEQTSSAPTPPVVDAAAGAPAPSAAPSATVSPTPTPTPSATVAAALPQPVAPAPLAPTDAPDTSAPSPRAVAAQVTPAVLSIAQRPAGTHQLTMTVTPDSLGPVTVRAHVSAGGDVQVELIGATDAGRDALRMIAIDLRRDLASILPTATLSLSHTAAGDASPGRDAGGQGSPVSDQGSGRRGGSDEQGGDRAGDAGRDPSRSIQTTALAGIGEGLDIFA